MLHEISLGVQVNIIDVEIPHMIVSESKHWLVYCYRGIAKGRPGWAITRLTFMPCLPKCFVYSECNVSGFMCALNKRPYRECK